MHFSAASDILSPSSKGIYYIYFSAASDILSPSSEGIYYIYFSAASDILFPSSLWSRTHKAAAEIAIHRLIGIGFKVRLYYQLSWKASYCNGRSL